MPTLRIMSIYKERKRTFASELANARTEREQFLATLVARFGKEAADVMRHEAGGRIIMALGRGGMPTLPGQISVAVKKLQALDRRVEAGRKKIRTADSWFREVPGPVSVLESLGLSWRMVNEKCSDGKMSISAAFWLLKVLRSAEHILPTEEQGWEQAATGPGPCRLSKKWRRRLHRRRRRLALLLHTAAMLEEDVQWEYRL